MKKTIKVFALGLAALIMSCSNDDNNKKVVTVPEVQVKTNATLGKILTDKDGRTLYYHTNDFDGKNACTGGCEAIWPVFNAEGLTQSKLSEGLDIADFATTTTASGKKQLTYKGHPLYYFAPKVNEVNTPEAAGEVKGDGVLNVWYVAKPDYTIKLTNAQLIGHDGKNYTSDYEEGTGKTSYLTDGKGLTLYTFKNDRKNKNNFTREDFSNNNVWTIYEEDQFVPVSSLDKSLFGTIMVHGKKQMTYKGWPLYYFGQDNKVMGSNKGISFPAPGVWPVAVKDMDAAVE